MHIAEEILSQILSPLASAMGVSNARTLACIILLLLVVLLLVFLILSMARSHSKSRKIDALQGQIVGLRAQSTLSGGELSADGSSVVYHSTGRIPGLPLDAPSHELSDVHPQWRDDFAGANVQVTPLDAFAPTIQEASAPLETGASAYHHPSDDKRPLAPAGSDTLEDGQDLGSLEKTVVRSREGGIENQTPSPDQTVDLGRRGLDSLLSGIPEIKTDASDHFSNSGLESGPAVAVDVDFGESGTFGSAEKTGALYPHHVDEPERLDAERSRIAFSAALHTSGGISRTQDGASQALDDASLDSQVDAILGSIKSRYRSNGSHR